MGLIACKTNFKRTDNALVEQDLELTIYLN